MRLPAQQRQRRLLLERVEGQRRPRLVDVQARVDHPGRVGQRTARAGLYVCGRGCGCMRGWMVVCGMLRRVVYKNDRTKRCV